MTLLYWLELQTDTQQRKTFNFKRTQTNPNISISRQNSMKLMGNKFNILPSFNCLLTRFFTTTFFSPAWFFVQHFANRLIFDGFLEKLVGYSKHYCQLVWLPVCLPVSMFYWNPSTNISFTRAHAHTCTRYAFGRAHRGNDKTADLDTPNSLPIIFALLEFLGYLVAVGMLIHVIEMNFLPYLLNMKGN